MYERKLLKNRKCPGRRPHCNQSFSVRGAREAVPQWGIRRRRKRPERVMRNEQSDRSKGALRRLSMRVMPDQAPSPAEPARHRAPGGQTAGRSSAGVKFSAKRSPATLTGTIFPGHSEATRAKAGRPYPSYSSSRSKITRITCSGFPITLSMMISAALILSRAGVR